jgi:hypothetical protein
MAGCGQRRIAGRGCSGALLLALAAQAMAGCGSVGPRTGLPPFAEARHDATEFSLRPLFRYKRVEALNRTEIDYLFPFGAYKRNGREIQNHLYPLFQYMRRVDEHGFEKLDWMATPLILGGNHGVEGSYLTFLPFGGTLRGALGKEYIVSVLFPLFAYTRLKDYETYHVLFPLIGWHAGPGNEGFRFLPFYAHHKRTNPDGVVLYDRTSILWPLFTWETNNNNSRNPWTSWVIFPVYGQVRSPQVDETYLFWPFFKHKVDKRADLHELHLPFPFVWVAWGKETARFDLWPLGGYHRNGGYSRWFALWPFIRHQRHESEAQIENDFWFLPVYWNWDRTYPDGSLDSEVKVWPLLRVDRRRDGRFSVHALSLLWFRDENRFEEVISPLWELFKYSEAADGRRDLHLLFNIFRCEWTPDGAPGPAESDWEVLGGLFGHKRKDGEGKVKLFWFFEL